ncbi:S-adenosylmethionine:tRNA ribosyltransferase-isomerase [Acetobacter estunensis NRIC 0472]|uniref:S-adenosylmethionine:tRNA ribosyltransferase-isomerase n=1 Tax=Acetobacter estunensis TaxID=104097 RepID=A0A967ED67_9PROT|nr:tRNA preQ1(34) S-adenosylmethionine ribosyltransferase-isomerase QueA [Acetobacter estunensis]NHO53680.1 tRNA preQ1(34) S-adenosylmethionine ribosyltransferase-isomerase QueA [Acetobacter estunensis]GBQ25209.1 S-adenosylmethionine:tRNA ribosyltransferase-isomerase [Acetobacter estunensis NRIC 0472]
MDDRTADFDFPLPETSIAQHPARPRDSARLLDVPADPAAPFIDRHVRDLPGLLREGDLLVANDTAVIPAQLHARRGEAKIGVTLDQHQANGSWSALIRNAKRLRPGDTLTFPGMEETAEVASLDGQGGATLRFSTEGDAFDTFLRTAGALALPPYIARPQGPTAEDERDYRTIFAEHRGAVAAPTAGLHFTPDLLARLDEAGIGRETLTLHVGAGTFLPVRTETLSGHKMHAERGIITPETAERINATKARGGRIVAVGTTTLRLLESAVNEDGQIQPFNSDTSIFIHPGFRFRAVDVLMTNFHLPRSTLFMLVCAFAGTQRMQAAYAHAIASGYRFYSYGDACLLRRAADI